MIYPNKPLLPSGPGFRVGDPSAFAAFLPFLYEQLIIFGPSGQMLIPPVPGAPLVVPLVFPTVDDLDALGNRLYPYAITVPASGSVAGGDYVAAVRWGPDLTDQAYARFSRLVKLADERAAQDAIEARALVVYLLSEVSPASRDTLKTHPGWDLAIAARDPVQMMVIIRFVHEHGNVRARMRYLREFVTSTQSRLSLDAYLGLLRTRYALVVSAFEDPVHPGFIATDLLLRCIFMLGLDQTLYERPIQRFNEDHPDDSAQAAMLVMQAYSRDVIGVVPVTSAAHVPLALVSESAAAAHVAPSPHLATPPKPPRYVNPKAGQFGWWLSGKHGKFCEWC